MALSEEARLRINLEAKNQAGPAFNSLNGQLNSLVSVAKKAGAALLAAFAFREVMSATQRWGHELDLLRDTIGVTGEEASKLNYIARTVGLDTEETAQAFGMLARRIASSSDEMQKGTDVFSKWGVKVLDASGNVLPFQEILGNINESVGRMQDGLGKTAAEMDLFGRSGKKMHDLLSLSKEEIADLAKEAEDLGLVLSSQTVAQMEQFERLTRRAGMAADALKIQLGLALMPALTAVLMVFLRFVKEVWPRFINLIRPILNGIRDLAVATWNLLGAMVRVVAAFMNAIGAGQRLSGVVKVIGEAFRIVVGIIKEVTARLEKFAADISSKGIIGAIFSLMQDILQAFGKKLGELGISFDTLAKAVEDAGKVVAAAASGDWKTAGQAFGMFFDDLKKALDDAQKNLAGTNPLETFLSSFTSSLTALGVVFGVANLSRLIISPLVFIGTRIAAVLGGWPVLIVAALVAGLLTIALHWDKIKDFFDEHVKPLWDDISRRFREGSQQAWDEALRAFSQGSDVIATFLSTAPQRFANWLGQSIPIWITNVGTLFRNLTNWVIDVGFPNLVTWVETNIPKVGDWLVKSIPTWLENIGTLFSNLIEWILGTGLPSLIDTLITQVMPAMWRWITEGIPMVLSKLGEWMTAIVVWVGTKLLPALVDGLFKLGQKMVEGLVKGLGELIEKAEPGFTTFMKNVGTWLSANIPMVGGVFAAVQWIIDRLNDAIRLWQQLPSWLGGGNNTVPEPTEQQRRDQDSGAFQLAEGGIVMPRPGGTLVNVGEGGSAEAVIPLGSSKANGIGGVTNIYVDVHDNVTDSEDALGRKVARSMLRDAQLRRQFSF